MLTLEEIKHAFDTLREATKLYWIAKLNLMQQERAYERVFNIGLYHGKITGKNEAERLGSMYYQCPDEVDVYLDSKEEEMQAKMNLELAKIEVNQIQSALAYLTVQVGTGMHASYDKDTQEIHAQ